MEFNQIRQCDVGSAVEQNRRFVSFCNSHSCQECPVDPEKRPGVECRCSMYWSQLPYDVEVTQETIKARNLAMYATREDAQRAFAESLPERFRESLKDHPLAALDMFCDWLFQPKGTGGL
jgi:hypothetical protein